MKRFNTLSILYKESNSRFYDEDKDDLDYKRITKVAKKRLIYRKIAQTLKIPIEDVKKMPLDDFFVAREQYKLVDIENIRLHSIATENALYKVINAINKSMKKGGE